MKMSLSEDRKGLRRISGSPAARRSLLTETGFTLLEIMISLAIIGGLLVTLLSTLNYHLSISERHEVLTVASMLAKNKIGEVEKDRTASSGEFPAPHSGYLYKAEVKGSSYPGVSEITVTVTRGSENVTFTELVETAK